MTAMTVVSFKPKNSGTRLNRARQHAPIERRRFSVTRREEILKALHIALQVDATSDLPLLFRLPVAVALKPGISNELAVRYNIAGDREDLRHQALHRSLDLYCVSSQYAHALITGNRRYGMDMEPDDPLDDADRKSGENRLKACNAQRDCGRRGSASMRLFSPPERP